MSKTPGIPYAAVLFFEDLRRNNTREWFAENRHYYDNVIVPALSEVLLWLWDNIRELYPDYTALPKVNKSFFRIFRDIRFSKDKSPLKTNTGLLIYRRTRKDSPFVYLHLAPEEVFWACGSHNPSMELVRRYRTWAAEPQNNARLGRELERLRGRYTVNEPQMKRIPREYKDRELEYPELLLYKGVHVSQSREPGPWLEEEPWLQDVVRLCRDCRPFMELVEEWTAPTGGKK